MSERLGFGAVVANHDPFDPENENGPLLRDASLDTLLDTDIDHSLLGSVKVNSDRQIESLSVLQARQVINRIDAELARFEVVKAALIELKKRVKL